MSVSIPPTLGGALEVLSADPTTTPLAGGTDLMVEINFGHRRPVSVLSVARLAELGSWTGDGDSVRLGAALTFAEMLVGDLAAALPALAEAARTVGSPQVRNVGTIGGNLGTGSPAGDVLPVLSALDAEIELASVGGTRLVSMHNFMTGVKRTVRRHDELIVSATVPVLNGWQGFAKVGVRNAMVISIASACLATDLGSRSVRVALGAVAPTVIRAREAERWVAAEIDWDARGVEPAVAAEFGRRVATESRPIDDHRSTADYRRHAISVIAGRLLTRAFS